jgi:hypothetical protein
VIRREEDQAWATCFTSPFGTSREAVTCGSSATINHLAAFNHPYLVCLGSRHVAASQAGNLKVLTCTSRGLIATSKQEGMRDADNN